MAVNFPNNPSNGDIIEIYGTNYYYDATISAWRIVLPSFIGTTQNNQILFNQNTAISGSNGLIFDAISNTFFANTIHVDGNVSAQYYTGNGALLTGIITVSPSVYDQANAAFEAANARVLRTGDTMSDVLHFLDNNLGVGPIYSDEGIDLLAQPPYQWAELNYANTNYVYVTKDGAFLYATDNTSYSSISTLLDGNIDIVIANSNATFHIYDGTNIPLLVLDQKGNLSVSGNVTTNYYYGNGAFLTGIVTDFSPAFNRANDAFTYANNTFLPLTGGIISGDLTIIGNTFFSNVISTVISDPLLYLAGNNYSSDAVTIGLVANYVNTTGQNVHTGLIRDPTTKQYYIFKNYDKEPTGNNIIDINGNNFTLAVLNADLISSNIALNGLNLYSWIAGAYTQANTGGSVSYAAFDQANAAYNQANTIGGAAFDKANAANLLAFNTSIGANNWANTVGIYGNTWANTIGVNANNWANTVSIYGNNYTNTAISSNVGALGSYVNTSALIIANSWANTIGVRANDWANLVVTSANAIAIAAFAQANAAYAAANIEPDFATANLALTIANAAYAQANTARDQANDAYTHANSIGIVSYAAFNQANIAYNQANTIGGAAFDKANAANLLAFNTGIGANNWANTAISSNVSALGSYVNTALIATNNYTNTTISSNVSALGSYVNTALIATNNHTNTAISSNVSALGSYVNTAFIATNNYTNTTISSNVSALGSYVNTAFIATNNYTNTTISSNVSALGSYVNTALISTNNYTNTAISSNVSALGSYVNTALIATNNYTNTAISSNVSALGSYVNTALTATNNYTNTAISLNVSALGSYVNTAISTNVSALGSYVNTALIATNNYTNTTISTNVSALGSYVNTALIATNNYTNTTISSNVSALGSYVNVTALIIANSWANTIGINANNWANTIGIYANNWANTIGARSNAYANSRFVANVDGATFVSGHFGFGNTVYGPVATDPGYQSITLGGGLQSRFGRMDWFSGYGQRQAQWAAEGGSFIHQYFCNSGSGSYEGVYFYSLKDDSGDNDTFINSSYIQIVPNTSATSLSNARIVFGFPTGNPPAMTVFDGNVAFNRTDAFYTIDANGTINAANILINQVPISLSLIAANNWANTAISSNISALGSYVNTALISTNNYTNTTISTNVSTLGAYINTTALIISNAWANVIGINANNWANTKLSNTTGAVFEGNLIIKTDLRIGNNLNNVTSLMFNTSTNRTPTVPGELTWSQDDSTLHFDMDSPSNVIGHIGQDLYIYAKNQTGGVIPKGNVVRFAGTVGLSGRVLINPATANNQYPSRYVFGMAASAINNGDNGFVLVRGKLRGLDLSAFNQGDVVYLSASTPGALTNIKPLAPNNKITIGEVISNDNIQGSIEIRVIPSSNLDDDEYVELNNLVNGDIISYVAANGRFENQQTLVSAYNKANAANLLAYNTGIGANNYANATFLKLTSPTSQTITSDLTILGNLSFSGNTTFSNVTTLSINDPLIYLAGNNYFGDITTIGFVANYVNATSKNVHTGLIRDPVSKEYYLFQEYNQEPQDVNWVDPAGNNFTIAVLNADLITSNLTLGGANAVLALRAAYDKANAANLLAFNTGAGANAYASAVGVAANAYASAAAVAANTYSATVIGPSANGYTNTAISANVSALGSYVNTAFIATNNYTNTAISSNVSVLGSYVNTALTATNNYTNTAISSNVSTLGSYVNTAFIATNNYTNTTISSNVSALGSYVNTAFIATNNYTNTTISSNISALGSYVNVTALIIANSWANTIGINANNWANTVAIYTNNYTNTAITANVAAGLLIANSWANTIGINANNWANTVANYTNNYTNTAITANVSALGSYVNTSALIIANSWANTIGINANNWANTIGINANNWANSVAQAANSYASSVGTAANAYASAAAVAANTFANNKFLANVNQAVLVHSLGIGNTPYSWSSGTNGLTIGGPAGTDGEINIFRNKNLHSKLYTFIWGTVLDTWGLSDTGQDYTYVGGLIFAHPNSSQATSYGSAYLSGNSSTLIEAYDGRIFDLNPTHIKLFANGSTTSTSNARIELRFGDDVKTTIDSFGNVLIGRGNSTVGQGVKLDVAGAINASAIFENGISLLANTPTFLASGGWGIGNVGSSDYADSLTLGGATYGKQGRMYIYNALQEQTIFIGGGGYSYGSYIEGYEADGVYRGGLYFGDLEPPAPGPSTTYSTSLYSNGSLSIYANAPDNYSKYFSIDINAGENQWVTNGAITISAQGLPNLLVLSNTGNILIGRSTSDIGQDVKLDVVGAVNASAYFANGVPLLANADGTVLASGNWGIGNTPFYFNTSDSLTLGGGTFGTRGELNLYSYDQRLAMDINGGGAYGGWVEGYYGDNYYIGGIYFIANYPYYTQEWYANGQISLYAQSYEPGYGNYRMQMWIDPYSQGLGTSGSIGFYSDQFGEIIRFSNTGNVLIGRTTSNVGQNVKLDVNGAINASAVLVNGSPIGSTIISDTENAVRYLVFVDATSGTMTSANVNTDLTYNPATNTLNVGNLNVVGSMTFISANSVRIGQSEINSVVALTTTTNDQILDVFSTTDWRSVDYSITLRHSGQFEKTQVSLIHDDLNTYMTEYGTLTSVNTLALFSSSIESGNVRFNIAPIYANTKVVVMKTATKCESQEVIYTVPGTYSWTVPEGVTSVCAVCIGAGSTGYELGYTYGGNSYFINESTVFGEGGHEFYGGGYVGDGGGNGGSGGIGYEGGGGGAGGYSGNGGDGGVGDGGGGPGPAATNGSGGGGGGGAGSNGQVGGPGGGTGLYGEGANGVAGVYNAGASGTNSPGGGGSGGEQGVAIGTLSKGGAYGGGGGGDWGGNGGGGGGLGWKNNISVTPGDTLTVVVGEGFMIDSPPFSTSQGANGAVRIIWGSGLSFPSNAT